MGDIIRSWTWNPEELEKAISGEDKWLTTILLNRYKLYTMKHYPYHLRRTYIAHIIGEDHNIHPFQIYATDDENAIRYLKSLFDEKYITKMVEMTSGTCRNVELASRKKTKQDAKDAKGIIIQKRIEKRIGELQEQYEKEQKTIEEEGYADKDNIEALINDAFNENPTLHHVWQREMLWARKRGLEEARDIYWEERK